LRISHWRSEVLGVMALMNMALAVSCTTQQELPQPSSPAPVWVPAAPSFSVPAAPRTSAEPSNSVRASYQGSAESGHRTASGEPYDPEDLTAASRTLPIGSTVVVTNPATGRSVKVRINDRGPHVRGRNLDLSKHAAEEIGMTNKGVTRLKIKRAESKPDSDSPGSSANLSSTSAP
jgi:rare lipoprotein A